MLYLTHKPTEKNWAIALPEGKGLADPAARSFAQKMNSVSQELILTFSRPLVDVDKKGAKQDV
jgi:hypothetical protein